MSATIQKTDMKQATGFVTDDGTFFESEETAALYEAECRLRARLLEFNGAIDPEKVLALILNVMPEMRRYVDAHQAANKRDHAEVEDGDETSDSGAPETDASVGHVSSTEEDLASLLQLPPRGPVNVSNVGSRPRSKKVPDRRPKHGS